MNITKISAAAVAIGLASVGLSACGSSSPSASGSPSAAASGSSAGSSSSPSGGSPSGGSSGSTGSPSLGGASYDGADVSFSTPSGWQDSTQQAKKASIVGDRMLFAGGDGAYRAAHNEMNVLATPDPGASSMSESDFKKSVMPQMASHNGKYHGTVSVDGMKGFEITATTKDPAGHPVPAEQVYVGNKDNMFIFTFASTDGKVVSDASTILKTVRWK